MEAISDFGRKFGIQYFSFSRLIREFSVSFIYISIIVVGLFLFLSALSSFLVLNGFIRKFYLDSIDRCEAGTKRVPSLFLHTHCVQSLNHLKKLKLTQFYIQNFDFNSSMHNVVKFVLFVSYE